jgi:hypothetical protein
MESYPIELNLNPGNMIALKSFLGLMMFVLAQDIDFGAFKKHATEPKSLILGVIGQIFMPAIYNLPSIGLIRSSSANCSGLYCCSSVSRWEYEQLNELYGQE